MDQIVLNDRRGLDTVSKMAEWIYCTHSATVYCSLLMLTGLVPEGKTRKPGR